MSRLNRNLKPERPQREKVILPADPEGMNEDRAAWAMHAVRAFQETTGTDDEDAVSDLLCDLHHLCDRMPKRFGGFSDQAARAERCYSDETKEC